MDVGMHGLPDCSDPTSFMPEKAAVSNSEIMTGEPDSRFAQPVSPAGFMAEAVDSGARHPTGTREIILKAAEALFYSTGIRSATMSEIAAQAGLTKRTLYYHFRSKDDLIEACLARLGSVEQDRFAKFLGDKEMPVQVRIRQVFAALAYDVVDPRWKGCYFARAASELAGLPGHPGLRAAVVHRKAVEAWIAASLSAAGLKSADTLARSFMLLFDGAIAQGFLHHDPSYIYQAGELVSRLVAEAERIPPNRTCAGQLACA